MNLFDTPFVTQHRREAGHNHVAQKTRKNSNREVVELAGTIVA